MFETLRRVYFSLITRKKELIQRISFYTLKAPSKEYDSFIITPFNELSGQQGLADRLRHILSVFIYCRKNQLNFKIIHNNPFRLSDYLEPNEYDWKMKEFEMSHSIWNTRVAYTWSYFKGNSSSEEKESLKQEAVLIKNSLKKAKQLHVYGNAHIYKAEWRNAFDVLFKPSQALARQIENLDLPRKFDAVTFRFQQLLGDFQEGNFKKLGKEEADELVEKCISELTDQFAKGMFSSEKILVTSDSVKFLKKVSTLPFVFVISGKILHPAFAANNSGEDFSKSFIDLLTLRAATSVTLFLTGEMYQSGFPEFASIIGSGRFEIHRF